MHFTRLLVVFAVALIGVVAQNVYLNRLADLFKKINGFTQEIPAFKPCVAGIPLDVDSWVKMDVPARKSTLEKLSTQTYNTLLTLTKDPNTNAQKLLDFDSAITAVVDVVVEGTQTDQLTAAPAATTPAPTTAAPTTAAPVATTTAPTTEKPTETTEEPTESPVSEAANSTTSSTSGSANTEIETVATESLAPTTAPKAETTAPEVKPTSASTTLRVAVPALVATVVAAFFAI